MMSILLSITHEFVHSVLIRFVVGFIVLYTDNQSDVFGLTLIWTHGSSSLLWVDLDWSLVHLSID